MDPNRPWNVKPQLERGDADPDAIYAAVGVALSKWEVLESTLAAVFGLLVGAEYTGGAQRAYGVVSQSASRRAMLQAAFESFPGRQLPDLKGFEEMLKLIGNFSARRNDVAHGHAMGHSVDHVNRGYFLVPPSYATQKFKKQTEWGIGDYAYTSDQILQYANEFVSLHKAAAQYLGPISSEVQRLRDKK